MNYKSQLKAWAIDRAIEAKKAGIIEIISMEDIYAVADGLADHCYEPDKEFKDAIAAISEYLKTTPNAMDLIAQLQGELAVIAEDIERQANMANATEH